MRMSCGAVRGQYLLWAGVCADVDLPHLYCPVRSGSILRVWVVIAAFPPPYVIAQSVDRCPAPLIDRQDG